MFNERIVRSCLYGSKILPIDGQRSISIWNRILSSVKEVENVRQNAAAFLLWCILVDRESLLKSKSRRVQSRTAVLQRKEINRSGPTYRLQKVLESFRGMLMRRHPAVGTAFENGFRYFDYRST